MGCSDRFDVDYCQYATGINIRTKQPVTCGKVVNGGVYCKEHTSIPLRKEDAEHTIAKLKKNRNCLIEWIEQKE